MCSKSRYTTDFDFDFAYDLVQLKILDNSYLD